jgi:hypothetical protein
MDIVAYRMRRAVEEQEARVQRAQEQLDREREILVQREADLVKWNLGAAGREA